MSVDTLIRFRDLKKRGILPNWTTAHRWIRRGLFPAPIRLGEQLVAWRESEVRQWLESRERVIPGGDT